MSLIENENIYSVLTKSVFELVVANPDSLSPLANPDSISFFLFDQMPTHFLPQTKMLTVTIHVPLKGPALELLYETLEILAKKYRFQIVKA